MSKRVLVMEDEKDNRQIIRDMLGGIDCEITEAEDAEQALAAIAKERPDLILMGIHLPIMNGYTVTRQIKPNPALRSIPVIAITSHALDGEEHIARAAGCDDYVAGCKAPAALPPKAGIDKHGRDVRFVPKADSAAIRDLLEQVLTYFCQQVAGH
jgi:two-component system cell cycle response regulator DivK